MNKRRTRLQAGLLGVHGPGTTDEAITQIQNPIILLGFHRSGTTMLGTIFSQHPDVAYFSEPRHIWMHAFPYRRFDILSAKDASMRVAKIINREFAKFAAENGRHRFAEKTPSNMVRLPFIRDVMPDCRVIHIIRDGRACTYSTVEILKRPPSGRLVRRRANAVPWWHYPSYILKAWRNLVVPRFTRKGVRYWGPRIPGLKLRVRQLPQDEMCAWQWQETMNYALRDARLFPADQYREWRYEDLVASPVHVVGEMFEFVGLEMPPGLDEWLEQNIHEESVTKWRSNMDAATIARITPHLQPLLGDLGYE
jgi:hypothetical protein